MCRFDDGAGGDNEVQRTMLELINQLDGFDPRGNIKVSFIKSFTCEVLVSVMYILAHFLQ
jgi:hypothetical protein